jgi:hypothetical protein
MKTTKNTISRVSFAMMMILSDPSQCCARPFLMQQTVEMIHVATAVWLTLK